MSPVKAALALVTAAGLGFAAGDRWRAGHSEPTDRDAPSSATTQTAAPPITDGPAQPAGPDGEKALADCREALDLTQRALRLAKDAAPAALNTRTATGVDGGHAERHTDAEPPLLEPGQPRRQLLRLRPADPRHAPTEPQVSGPHSGMPLGVRVPQGAVDAVRRAAAQATGDTF